MSNETLFYICGVVLAVSAVGFSFAGLKFKNFPGRVFPLVIAWFVIFVGAATTFAVLHAQDEEQHKEATFEQAGKEIEKAEGGVPTEVESGAGEESEASEQGETSEEAEEAGSSEPVGPEEGEAGEEGGGEEAGGAGDPAAGKTVFAENCSVCHGATGHGGNGGPDLRTMPLAQTEEGAIEQVTNGGGGMPPFGGQLSEEEITDVAAYVVHEIVGKQPADSTP